MEQEVSIRAMPVKNEEFAKKYANELLGKLGEFNKMKRRVELLTATLKKYMEDNNMDIFNVENGKLTIVEQKRNILNKALIDDIDQYYDLVTVKIMYKQPK